MTEIDEELRDMLYVFGRVTTNYSKVVAQLLETGKYVQMALIIEDYHKVMGMMTDQLPDLILTQLEVDRNTPSLELMRLMSEETGGPTGTADLLNLLREGTQEVVEKWNERYAASE